MKKNIFYTIILLLIFICSNLLSVEKSRYELEYLAENMIGGGPPKDGIPPIDKPNYISFKAASLFLHDDDVVFIVEDDREVKIYPQKIMVWHEIVNDEFDGSKGAVTYCPLTGSAIGYYTTTGKVETTVGTSGKLVNSNLVMYDRATDSFWPQISGTAVLGKLKGQTFKTFPVIWTRWKFAKKKYKNAKVLSVNTGFMRSYGRDPYGSYLRLGTYYDSGDALFPLLNRSEKLKPKDLVIGIKTDNDRVAISEKRVIKERLVNIKAGKSNLVALYDPELDVVRVFSSSSNGYKHTLYLKGETISDRESGSYWNYRGEAVLGKLKGKKLDEITYFKLFWFAWNAYYPDSKLY